MYYLTLSRDQESGSGLIGWLWLWDPQGDCNQGINWGHRKAQLGQGLFPSSLEWKLAEDPLPPSLMWLSAGLRRLVSTFICMGLPTGLRHYMAISFSQIEVPKRKQERIPKGKPQPFL